MFGVEAVAARPGPVNFQWRRYPRSIIIIFSLCTHLNAVRALVVASGWSAARGTGFV